MQAISRRALFATASGAVLVAALAGCSVFSSGSVNAGLAQASQDALIVANGLKATLPQLGALNVPGLTPAVIAKVGAGIADAQAVATSLQTATSLASAQPLVQQLETDVNAVVAALAVLPLPPQVALPLQAAAILLPVIETAVQLAVANAPASPAAPSTSAMAMTPDEARAILKGVAIGAH